MSARVGPGARGSGRLSCGSSRSQGSDPVVRLPVLLFAFAFLSPAAVAQKQRVDKAADLPRFTYKIDGPLENVVTNPAAFARFAAEVRRDNEDVLARYDIADRAAQRQLLSVLAQIDF